MTLEQVTVNLTNIFPPSLTWMPVLSVSTTQSPCDTFFMNSMTFANANMHIDINYRNSYSYKCYIHTVGHKIFLYPSVNRAMSPCLFRELGVKKITSNGVLLGSVLSPLLFILYYI